MMHQEVRPFPSEGAWERLLLSCRNTCSKDASQEQMEKSLVLSVGRINVQIYTEMFLYILTNTGKGGKGDYWGQGWDLKMKHVIGGSGLLLGGLTPTEDTCVQEQRWLWLGISCKTYLQQSCFPFPLGLQQEVPNPDIGGFKGTILLLKSHHSLSAHRLLQHRTLALICQTSSFPNLSRIWKLASW